MRVLMCVCFEPQVQYLPVDAYTPSKPMPAMQPYELHPAPPAMQPYELHPAPMLYEVCTLHIVDRYLHIVCHGAQPPRDCVESASGQTLRAPAEYSKPKTTPPRSQAPLICDALVSDDAPCMPPHAAAPTPARRRTVCMAHAWLLFFFCGSLLRLQRRCQDCSLCPGINSTTCPLINSMT